MFKATKEQREALVERMKLFLEIEGVPTEQQIALMEKYEAEMGEELSTLYDNYMWERGTLEEFAKDMPHPHNKAIIVFGGEEMPYSENRDESLAGNREAKEKWNNTDKVPGNHPVRAMRDALNEKTRQMWDESGLEPEEWAEAYDAMQEAMESVGDKIESAKTHEELDEIRDSLKPIKARLFEFNRVKGQAREHIAAIDARCAREAFENDERIRSARERIDEETASIYQRRRGIAEEQALRDGLDGGRREGVSGTDYAVNGFLFRPASGKNASNDYYLNALKKFTPTQQNTAQAQSRSDNQGGFSDGQILDQNGGKVTRGRIWRDRRQGKKIIQLLSTADRSTFLHEMGHLFLMDLEDLAGMGDEESQRMLDEVDDWAKWQGKGDAKKYVGTEWAEEFADREAAILEADRAGDLLGRDALMARWRQERFARAWEIYLMEGTAPSKGLRAVFRTFKSWLRKIYDIFISDGARASKDVEKVMARLVASEEEIERMEGDRVGEGIGNLESDFNPRPTCGGRRRHTCETLLDNANFNPRPTCGGRLLLLCHCWLKLLFQSTPSVRRATGYLKYLAIQGTGGLVSRTSKISPSFTQKHARISHVCFRFALYNQRSLSVISGLCADMLDLRRILIAQIVKAKAVFLRINQLFQLMLHFPKLRLIQDALEYRILHPLPMPHTAFCHRAQSSLSRCRFRIHVIGNQNQHWFPPTSTETPDTPPSRRANAAPGEAPAHTGQVPNISFRPQNIFSQ